MRMMVGLGAFQRLCTSAETEVSRIETGQLIRVDGAGGVEQEVGERQVESLFRPFHDLPRRRRAPISPRRSKVREKPPRFVEALEARQVFAAVFPTDVEQYLVELINRARANPAAEAARFGIDLNEGLPAGTISTAPKPPLAVNPFLTDAARGHSQWMLDHDVFSHTGAGGSTPTQRMQAAGYVLTAPASTGYPAA